MRPVDRDRRNEALRAANRPRRGVRLPSWGSRGATSSRSVGSGVLGARGISRAAGWLTVLPMALLLFLLLRTFVVEAFRIPSSSMERTLLVGDFLLVNKWVYGAEIPFTHTRLPALRAPRHADVIVFDWPVDPDKAFVKRLVGLPGDTLAMQQGVLQRNGATVTEPYLAAAAPPAGANGDGAAVSGAPRDSWGPLVVPPGHFFVLGDNRANSLDSRYWGFVPDRMLRGAPWFVYYSFTPDTAEAAPWLTRIRWARLGTTVR
jgi:signal peptidase I